MTGAGAGRPVRFAVLGCGVIAGAHAKAIRSLGERAAFVLAVDEVPAAARRLAQEYGVEAQTDVAAALARPDVDAVAICTPSGTHADLAVAALRAGKHVVVEKPIDVTVAAADRLVEAERSTGRRATVISQHRFDASSRLVRQAVLDGRLGTLTSGVVSVAWWRGQEYYDSGAWRGTLRWDGGGAVMNQSIHTIDLLTWMLGEPVEVYAMTARLAHTGIEVEDTCAATVRFAGGALGTIHATTAAYPGLTARLQIHGTAGSAVIDADRLVHLSTADGDTDVGSAAAANGPGAGRTGPPIRSAGADPTALSDAHTAQYRDFVDAVVTDRPPAITVADARQTLALVEAMYASAAAGRPVRVG